MKNIAIDRTSEIFSADQVSMWRSCRRARRGPRPPPERAGPRLREPRSATVAESASFADWDVAEEPAAGGTGGAPGGPPAGCSAAGALPLPAPCARRLPVVGIDCVAVAGGVAA